MKIKEKEVVYLKEIRLWEQKLIDQNVTNVRVLEDQPPKLY